MSGERCAVCGDTVPFEATAHVVLNAMHVEGVDDHYVCRACYEEHFEDLFE